MVCLAYFIFWFALIRLAVSFLNFAGKQNLPKTESSSQVLVSILIPARNEENNLPGLLTALKKQTYANLEFIIYDDLSEDNTWNIAQSFAAKDKRFKAIRGKGLPEGWLGKNHACHQLAENAKGELLLFIDADVVIRDQLVNHTVSHLQRRNLKLLSIFPVQIMQTLPEKIIVPLMNWILVSLLPLYLTRASSWSSFSAANGQFMLFDAATYKKNWYHKKLRKEKVEDIAIFRTMKKTGMKVQTLLGSKQIQCRMYKNTTDAINGFTKNVFEFFGGSKVITILFVLITSLGFIPVFLAFGFTHLLIYFGIVLAIRLNVSLASKQSVWQNLFLAPLQQSGFIAVVIKALLLQSEKKTLWKGRNIDQI